MGSEFWKSKSGFKISILQILKAPIFRQNGQLWILGLKFAQKLILGSEFQKSKSGFGINTSNIPCVPIFSQKIWGNCPITCDYWFKYWWGCCRELGRGWNELGGGGWRWVDVEMSWGEVDGAGRRWVHGLVIPNFCSKLWIDLLFYWYFFISRCGIIDSLKAA